MNNHLLANKRALVTGGSRGIGAAIVKRLAGEGAHVVLTYVSKPDQANETAKMARASGVQALTIQADNADAEAVVAAVEQTVRELGGIDILVNNAGIAVMAPIDDFRLEDFDHMVAVNLREYKEEDTVTVRFFPNGTSDEMTVVYRSAKNEWRRINLEVTTGMPYVESDMKKD